MSSRTRWRVNWTWTRKNSWSVRAKCPWRPDGARKNKKLVLFGPKVDIVLPLYKVTIVLTKYSHLIMVHPISRTWFALYRVTHKLWLINNDSSWKFEMTSANEPGAWMLMKVSLVISGPSGPDELTNCLTWNDIDWLWLRYQVMFWSWTGYVTSFDLLNTVVLWLW